MWLMYKLYWLTSIFDIVRSLLSSSTSDACYILGSIMRIIIIIVVVVVVVVVERTD